MTTSNGSNYGLNIQVLGFLGTAGSIKNCIEKIPQMESYWLQTVM